MNWYVFFLVLGSVALVLLAALVGAMLGSLAERLNRWQGILLGIIMTLLVATVLGLMG